MWIGHINVFKKCQIKVVYSVVIGSDVHHVWFRFHSLSSLSLNGLMAIQRQISRWITIHQIWKSWLNGWMVFSECCVSKLPFDYLTNFIQIWWMVVLVSDVTLHEINNWIEHHQPLQKEVQTLPVESNASGIPRWRYLDYPFKWFPNEEYFNQSRFSQPSYWNNSTPDPSPLFSRIHLIDYK